MFFNFQVYQNLSHKTSTSQPIKLNHEEQLLDEDGVTLQIGAQGHPKLDLPKKLESPQITLQFKSPRISNLKEEEEGADAPTMLSIFRTRWIAIDRRFH